MSLASFPLGRFCGGGTGVVQSGYAKYHDTSINSSMDTSTNDKYLGTLTSNGKI